MCVRARACVCVRVRVKTSVCVCVCVVCVDICSTCVFSNTNKNSAGALIFSVPHFPALLMETVLLLFHGGNLRFSVTFLCAKCSGMNVVYILPWAYECMSCTLHTIHTCILDFILVPVRVDVT